MPPCTRSYKKGKPQKKIVDIGVCTSNPRPDGNMMSMMTQMVANITKELMEMDARIDGRLKESEIRIQTTHTLLEEINMLKESRFSKSTTPQNDSMPNLVSEENVGEEEYEGRHGGVDGFGGMSGEFGRNMGCNVGNEHFGMGNGVRGHFGGGWDAWSVWREVSPLGNGALWG